MVFAPNYAPQRIVSLQPSITVTLDALGALDRVVACTKYCADVLPHVVTPTRRIVADSWSTSAAEILTAAPDLVMASVPYRNESLVEILRSGVAVLCFAPHCLEDIYRDTQFIANIVGYPDQGRTIISRMQSEIAQLRSQPSREKRPTVYCEEWGKPLIHSQQWVAELVEAAGGTFIGSPGKQTTSEGVAALDPDVIVAAWCGAGDRVPLEKMIQQRGWQNLRAVHEGRVYCINDEYLNTPAITLLDGLHALYAAIHPDAESIPKGLRQIAR